MKKQLQFLALSLWLLALSFTTLGQTTRRVNGDPNITGVNVYNTIQAAVDAANTDDVILIEPYGDNIFGTSASYNESVIINKRLHVAGNGLPSHPIDGPNPLNTDILDKRTVIVYGLTFDTGSSGSSIKSLWISYALSLYDSGIHVSSCFLGSVNLSQRSNNTTLISKASGSILSKFFLLLSSRYVLVISFKFYFINQIFN